MRLALLLAVLVATGFLPLLPQPARAVGPIIVVSYWDPEFPQTPERLTLMALVQSDGVNPIVSVEGTYCTVPVGVCTFHTMSNAGGDVWNVTVPMYEGAVGAKFLAFAYDGTVATTGLNMSIHYANSMSVRATVEPATALPEGTVTASGTLLYNNDEDAPARYSTVTVSVDGTSAWAGTTNHDGTFSYSWAAPTDLGDHAVRITGTNRSITGSYNAGLLVVSTPQPDFEATSVALTPTQPKPGDTVSLTALVKNTGNLAGTGTVTLAVDGQSLKTETVTLDPGEEHEVTATWVMTGGAHTVRLSVSAPGDTNSPNNVESVPLGKAEPPYLLIGAGVGIAAVALLAGALFLRRRKQ